jgi:hypothetical protein
MRISAVVNQTIIHGITWCIVALGLSCSNFVQPEIAMDPDPVMPPVNNIYIYAGYGTDTVFLQMRMDNVERILGQPITSTTNAGITKKAYTYDDADYTVYYQNNQVSGIILNCDRYVALAQDTIAAQYYESKAGLVARIGQPDRDEGFTWYYDAEGIAFEYDNNTLRVTSVYVYPPSTGLGKYFWFSRIWATDTVDNNHNGYAQQFKLNYDIDCSKTGGGDSLDVYVLYKVQGDPSWTTLSTPSVFVNGAVAADAGFITIYNADRAIYDFKLAAVYQDTTIVAISYLRGMKLESASQD